MSSRRTNIVSCGLQVNKTVGDVGHVTGLLTRAAIHTRRPGKSTKTLKYPMKTFHLLIFLCNLTRLEGDKIDQSIGRTYRKCVVY